jgi:hypothetical protein
MRTSFPFVVIFSLACGAEPGRDAVDIDAIAPPPSSESMAAALAHFRQGLPETHTLGSASTSRDALVMRFVTALENADTAAFEGMMMNRAEFAWLFYPYTKHTRPPYEMEAELLWFFMIENGRKGIGRALREYGGNRLGYQGYHCAAEPEIEGPNRLWQGCVLRLGSNQGVLEKRLFGSILEREGSFKFVSFSNDL